MPNTRSPVTDDCCGAASPATATRRAFLRRFAGSVGPLALGLLLAEERRRSAAGDAPGAAPPAPSGPAKSVIVLFQHGGPSQMDLFDPKPALQRFHGKPYPHGRVESHFRDVGAVMRSPFRFAPRGRSGIEMSDAIPHIAGIADDVTLVRSMTTESIDHEAGLRVVHTGRPFPGHPSWPSWISYGLGAGHRNLPDFVVLRDPSGLPLLGERNWDAGFLGSRHQGVEFAPGDTPVHHLRTPEDVPPSARSAQLRFLERLNRRYAGVHPENPELFARIATFEAAARMQTEVPEVASLDGETAETAALYGLDDPVTADYGRRCLLARRLVERGVRCVLVALHEQPWDTHADNDERLRQLCPKVDRPSAALVTDLKRRGLLGSTLVVWTGEFGRTPIEQGAKGRDHNRQGFSLWLAGGGTKAGHVHGATDDFSYKAVEDPVSVHDLHATLLHLFGLDHDVLSFPFDGRDSTLSDSLVTGAAVVRGILA